MRSIVGVRSIVGGPTVGAAARSAHSVPGTDYVFSNPADGAIPYRPDTFSDRWRSRDFVAVRRAAKLTGSMGQVASAGDNAAMESFNALLQKNVLNRKHWATRDELRYEIIYWIEHSDMASPVRPYRQFRVSVKVDDDDPRRRWLAHRARLAARLAAAWSLSTQLVDSVNSIHPGPT